MNLNDIHTIYFIGIGGIGMSALARFFKKQGKAVHGYDKTETALTKRLVREGMHVHYVDDVALLPAKVDLVVWTPAMPKDHKELIFFQNSTIPMKKRAEVLGMISRSHRLVGVGGTHGKTTTSCMATHFIQRAGVDCSAFLGGIALNYKSNYVEGDSNWVVAEADEYDRSFLQLHPEVAIINAIDPDHLDIYGDEATIKATYEQYARQVQQGGLFLYKAGLDLVDVAEVLQKSGRKVATFGVESGDYCATNLRVEASYFVFDFQWPAGKVKGVKLRFPGKHNVENACAALAAALYVGLPTNKLKRAVSSFKGIQRRFDYIVRRPDCVYIDDYAHHPEELKAVISAVKNFYSGKKITAVFQPHLFSRTRDFLPDFAAALDMLDCCLLLDIYPAREQPIPGITAQLILDTMQSKDKHLLSKKDVLEYVKKQKPEVFLTLGAGDVSDLVPLLKNQFNTLKISNL